ncbi:hypothetical protein TASIC1_0019001400 [Trichoderma asperellum]|uniref:Uncharacterized protein n=1 Tax=Trichoderma asperellum TaxID=101201 RepID=A0A6V8RBT2_TRIAP|nr:hypothetical protein TASIC1_0019001400 [Trichoderma asperellum]
MSFLFPTLRGSRHQDQPRFSRRAGLRNSAPPPPEPLYQQLLAKEIEPQEESPLFSLLPPEIRTKIFTFVLLDYEDTDSPYHLDTCYSRPSYFAPRKTSTELLRTCRAIYRETWFLPFILTEQTHWISAPDRAPPGYQSWHSIRKLRELLPEISRQLSQDKVEIESLHAFAQMYRVEEGGLADLLHTPGLHPRRLALTIRHTDWWFWEDDEPLRFEADWISLAAAAMSPSTQEFRLELESLERKKDQIDTIGKHIAENWFFKKSDGNVLYADISGKCHEVSRWTGTSTWHNKRWTRDENTDGKLDYYILTITFMSESSLVRRGGVVSETARSNAGNLFYQHIPVNLKKASEVNSDLFHLSGELGPVYATPILPLPSESDDEDLW